MQSTIGGQSVQIKRVARPNIPALGVCSRRLTVSLQLHPCPASRLTVIRVGDKTQILADRDWLRREL